MIIPRNIIIVLSLYAKPAIEEYGMGDEVNLISEIRDAERKAEEMIASAQAEGGALIEKIREEYRQKTLFVENEFHSNRIKTIEQAQRDAEAEALHIFEETEREIARIKLNAEKRIVDAADFLIRKMLE